MKTVSSGSQSLQARLPLIFSGLLLSGAIFICFRHYLSMRAFWLDEAFIASNLQMRSPLSLFGPLDHGQVFPRLYLFVISIIKSILGYDFWTLRLLPFLFGLSGMTLWVILFHREFPSYPSCWPGLLAVAALLAAPDVYYFAGELKQYSGDFLFTAYGYGFFRHILLPAIENGGKNKWLVIGWVWPSLFSLTYNFVLLACLSVGLAKLWLINKDRRWDWVLALGAGLMLSLGMSYLIDMRFAQYAGLIDYWQNFFVNSSSPSKLFLSTFTLLKNIAAQFWIASPSKSLILLGVAAMGAVFTVWSFFLKDGKSSYMILVGSALISELIFLSILKKYPLAPGRLIYFFFPFYVAMIAGFFYELSQNRFQWIRAGVMVSAIVGTFYFAGIMIPRTWKIYFNYSHWEDINQPMKLLDPSYSKTVVYAEGLDWLFRTHPHLRQEFTYIPIRDILYPHTPTDEARRKVGEKYYLISIYKWDGAEDAMKQFVRNDYVGEKNGPYLTLYHKIN